VSASVAGLFFLLGRSGNPQPYSCQYLCSASLTPAVDVLHRSLRPFIGSLAPFGLPVLNSKAADCQTHPNASAASYGLFETLSRPDSKTDLLLEHPLLHDT
jgi:hypothetical protein